ncbi:DUF4177 domain-containing protein [Pseudaestuariivita sp.]|uniref:DUF4177 domain-containing protein n=1 Tax=Pseudaestuariivita sp. TaxID=2211669 RepID=UPI004058782A
MIAFEYKVVPAPQKGQKAKGVRSTEAKFALALERVMNEMAEGGWEYQRTDTLPCTEREGLIGTAMTYQSMLVFRRAKSEDVAAFHPRQLETQTPVKALPPAEPAAASDAAEQKTAADAADAEPTPERAARPELSVVKSDAAPKAAPTDAPAALAKRPNPRTAAPASPGPALMARARQLAAKANARIAAE